MRGALRVQRAAPPTCPGNNGVPDPVRRGRPRPCGRGVRGYPGCVPLRLDLGEPRVDLAPLAAALAEGACAVIPTDTVYGLVGDAAQTDACLRLSELKRRDPGKPSTVMFASVGDAE